MNMLASHELAIDALQLLPLVEALQLLSLYGLGESTECNINKICVWLYICDLKWVFSYKQASNTTTSYNNNIVYRLHVYKATYTKTVATRSILTVDLA